MNPTEAVKFTDLRPGEGFRMCGPGALLAGPRYVKRMPTTAETGAGQCFRLRPWTHVWRAGEQAL